MDQIKKSTNSRRSGCITVREHEFIFPLDWNTPSEEKITVFVREIFKSSVTIGTVTEEEICSRPAVLFLQGGPGFPSPRPTVPLSGFMSSVLDKDSRLLLLDQRGTGNSTPVDPQHLNTLFTKGGVDLQAQYLSNMRSDAIAADVEAIRQELCGNNSKLSLLGQSFGGFCMLSYMSNYSTSNIDKLLFTCGLAPVTRTINDVYTATCRRMLARNKRYYSRYPDDVLKVKQIVRCLQQGGLTLLPNGGYLTVRRFLQLGIVLGSAEGMETLHNLFENAFYEKPNLSNDQSQTYGILRDTFLLEVQNLQSCFETNPIYWLMHESIYMNGSTERAASVDGASNWAAETVLTSSEFEKSFNPQYTLMDAAAHVNFTGEMVFSWMAEDYASLRPFKNVANVLATKRWERPLYDLNALAGVAKRVKCAALVSYDDVYVERSFAEETAQLLGGEDFCKLWISNEFQHSGLRDCPARVFDTLFNMAQGTLSIPS